MVEDIQEIFHRVVLLPSSRNQKLRIGGRHDGDCGTETHELHRHAHLAVLHAPQLVKLAGGKRKRSARRKPDRLSLRSDEIPNRLAILLHSLKHAHSLKEVHAKRLFIQQLAKIPKLGPIVFSTFLRSYSSA